MIVYIYFSLPLHLHNTITISIIFKKCTKNNVCFLISKMHPFPGAFSHLLLFKIQVIQPITAYHSFHKDSVQMSEIIPHILCILIKSATLLRFVSSINLVVTHPSDFHTSILIRNPHYHQI